MHFDLLIARITAGYLRCPQNGKILHINYPSLDVMYEATEIYYQTLKEAEDNGVMTDDDIFSLLIDLDIWTENKEKAIHDLPKEMDQFKVRIFEQFLNKKERETIRLYLNRAKEVYESYIKDRHLFDHVSCEGLANFAKWTYIIEQSTTYKDRPVDWGDFSLSSVMNFYYDSFISELSIREIAKNEPWSSIWTASKKNNCGVFNLKHGTLTHDQRRLILWSTMYDNISESSECPSDKIIMDNDALDGWLILKRKERESDTLKNQTENKLSDKVSKADEIYLVANDVDEAREIDKLNDIHAARVKKMRINQLKEEGQVHEIHFKDSVQKIQIALNQKGRKG